MSSSSSIIPVFIYIYRLFHLNAGILLWLWRPIEVIANYNLDIHQYIFSLLWESLRRPLSSCSCKYLWLVVSTCDLCLVKKEHKCCSVLILTMFLENEIMNVFRVQVKISSINLIIYALHFLTFNLDILQCLKSRLIFTENRPSPHLAWFYL